MLGVVHERTANGNPVLGLTVCQVDYPDDLVNICAPLCHIVTSFVDPSMEIASKAVTSISRFHVTYDHVSA